MGLLVIVLIIDENGIFAIKGEGQPPVPIHPHRPMILHATFKRMQSPAGDVHIGRRLRPIEVLHLPRQPCRVVRLNAGFGARIEERLDATMPETLDHARIVAPRYTPFKNIYR